MSGGPESKSGGKGRKVKKVSEAFEKTAGAEKEKSKDNGGNNGILEKTEKGRSAILGVGMGINAAGGESDKKSL